MSNETGAVTGVHPYAEKFPRLPEEELAELVESIRANGLRQPIVITPDGLILDGRNRHAACLAAEVEPVTEVYEGDDLAEYVIDANGTRRHMTTGARAMSTALVLSADGRRKDGRWQYGKARESFAQKDSQEMGVAVSKAGTVLDHVPDLAGQVVVGDLALDAAYRKAVEVRDRERNRLEARAKVDAEEADAKAFVEETAPDLARQVGGDGPFQSYGEARDVWNRRNREEAARIKAEKAAAEKEVADDRAAMTDLYSGIARGLQTCGVYGAYEDIETLMERYSVEYLHPPQYEREFEEENLRSVVRFGTALLKWKAKQ